VRVGVVSELLLLGSQHHLQKHSLLRTPGSGGRQRGLCGSQRSHPWLLPLVRKGLPEAHSVPSPSLSVKITCEKGKEGSEVFDGFFCFLFLCVCVCVRESCLGGTGTGRGTSCLGLVYFLLLFKIIQIIDLH
jgi:hypothetical protein